MKNTVLPLACGNLAFQGLPGVRCTMTKLPRSTRQQNLSWRRYWTIRPKIRSRTFARPMLSTSAPAQSRLPFSGMRSFRASAVSASRSTKPDTSDEPRVLCSMTKLPSGTLATITVSNPRKLNIVNTPLLVELAQTFTNLATDASLRAVVLTGAKTNGKAPAFIGGADIREMHAIQNSAQAREFIGRIHTVCEAMRTTLSVPVIGKVDGFALGGGLEILAACDLRVATRRSVFGMPEVRVGLPSVAEARLLAELVGWGRARRLVYLAENINADTAERWGLVEEVVDGPEQLDEKVGEWVSMIASAGPRAIRAQKELVRVWEEGNVDHGIKAGIDCLADTFEDGGTEPRELLGAFVNRKR